MANEDVKDFGYVEPKEIRFKVQGKEYTGSGRPGLRDLMAAAAPEPGATATGRTAFLRSVDRVMEVMLDDASFDQYMKATSSEVPPEERLTETQLADVVRWLMSEVSGRPTVSPDDSSG